MIMPSAMAQTEMRMMGLEIFLAAVLLWSKRWAIKNSKFKRMKLFSVGAKYRQLALALALFPLLLSAQLKKAENLKTGAENTGAYLPLVYGKSVAIVANQTSMIGDRHLVDVLLNNKVEVAKVFSPEHGFRGQASAGEKVNSSKDSKTGLPIISLYGKNKKPTKAQLDDVDIVIFDIQDVGARFYTYISTLSYVMEACAENQKKLIVLDRPNPNGYYIDGPVLKPGYESFVGLHPVPVVYGMTIGEYAQMVNGEGWLKQGRKCLLEVVRCSGYNHETAYHLPIPPSPNLPNKWAVSLYPSLCFFEGTTVSVGRGTTKPFQQIGAPYFTEGSNYFTPISNPAAKFPKHEGKKCRGFYLGDFAEYYVDGLGELYLYWLVETYKLAPNKEVFFTNFFDKLAGSDQLRKQVIEGKSVDEIKISWKKDLDTFKQIRSKYLLYP